jgi:DNA polymerase-3 subunit alpha
MLLNCHTYYSLCYGTLSIETLLDEVQRKGYYSFALTDINNTSACLDTLRLLSPDNSAWRLKPVIGIDFRNGVQQKYVGLAMNNEGFRELNEHLSHHLHTSCPFNEEAPAFNNAYIIYPLRQYTGWKLRGNEFIGISIKDLTQLPFNAARHQKSKLVALHSVSFGSRKHFNAHRLLRSIDTNIVLSKLSEQEQGQATETMLSSDEMYSIYGAWPHIIDNTQALLRNCKVQFKYGKFANKNKRHFKGSTENDLELLKTECEKGLIYRYGKNPPADVSTRIQKEMDIIEEMGFAAYFLINWDIVRYAREKDYYYVGRGSGANSMLAYLLRITDVDPIQLDLYFERFINKFRNNPPDFDIDFSWTDRDDITRYIFGKYGYERTALLGAYNTFQKDAVIRELGKVFGLPPAEIDKLQKVEDLKQVDKLGGLVLKYSSVIEGFPSHLSVHSSGILISEEPVTCYSATILPPKGYPTTQFSMLEAEDIGLYKFDILSQRGLGKIKDALDIVKENKGVEIDIHQVDKFYNDDNVKNLLRTGNAIGCFYVESPAMRMLLAKLRADDYLSLVAASSIIRPGVARSGMMREYILRFREEKRRKEAEQQLPELYNLLRETHGVMVYQEDVIRVAHDFAGLTMAESDYLRRGMSWKFKQRNEFHVVREKFFSNCLNRGHSLDLVQKVWEQIESFANFAFSKGHSASYAVESYQALYLKAHYPLEYLVATLNNGGGFYRRELYVHEARKHKADIKMPCVNNSTDKSVIKGDVIYLGLSLIAELEAQTTERIVEERKTNGPYIDVMDFIRRVPLSLEQMRLLVRAGTFAFTGKNKRELLWEIHALINPRKKRESVKELFEVQPKSWQLPQLSNTEMDEAFDELELLGFSLSSPFKLVKDEVPQLTSKELKKCIGQEVTIAGYMIAVKTTTTIRGDRMYFGTFLDIKGEWLDTVHFPPSAKQFPFSGPGCYVMKGKATEEYDFVTLEVSEMRRMPMIDPEKIIEKPNEKLLA